MKWYTALKANEVLHRTGASWQHESYDHLVRDAEELERIIQYILNNPVKAGFVKNWRDWRWDYRKLRMDGVAHTSRTLRCVRWMEGMEKFIPP